MEDNKLNTQQAGTPNAGNNEVNGGRYLTQTDLDNLVVKIRGEERAKREELIKQATADAIAEHERRARLTADEKEKEAKTKRDAELKERENNITMRERRLEAQELLASKNIPVDLVDFVVDLDETKTKDNIEKLAKTFNKSVENGVTDKLKGKAPTDFSSSNNGDKSKKIVTAF